MNLILMVTGVIVLLMIAQSFIKYVVNRIEDRRYNEVERIAQELKEDNKLKNNPENE